MYCVLLFYVITLGHSVDTHLISDKDNEKIHAYLGHVVQAIVDNRGYGLGQKQESMLEMLHQLFRLFRKSVARTTGKTSNKVDVITRMSSLYKSFVQKQI